MSQLTVVQDFLSLIFVKMRTQHIVIGALALAGSTISAAVETKAGWTSLGCYIDNSSSRTLSKKVSLPGGSSTTTTEAPRPLVCQPHLATYMPALNMHRSVVSKETMFSFAK